MFGNIVAIIIGRTGVVRKIYINLTQTQKYTIAALLFFTVVSIIIFRGPLFNGDPHTVELVGDLAVPTNLDNFIQDYYPTWSDYFSKSNLILLSRYTVFMPLFGVAKLFNIHPMTIIELFWLLTGIVAGFGAYLLSFYLLKREFKNVNTNIIFAASLLAGLFYLWNPFFANESRHMVMRFSYALLPLVFLTCIVALEKVKFRYIFLAAVAWVFIASGPRWSIYGGIALLLSLIYVIFYHRVFTIKGIIRLFRTAVIIGVVVIILSAFWLIPTAISSSVTQIDPDYLVSVDKLQQANPYNFTDIISFNMETQYLENQPSSFTPEISVIKGMGSFYIILKLLIPVFAFGILIFRRSVHTLFLFVMVIISMLILAVGSNDILWNIYVWWTLKAPWSQTLGWISKRTFYFFPFYMFSLSVLLGITIAWILEKLYHKQVVRKASAILVVCILFTAVVFTSWPLFTGDFNGELEPVKLPESFFSANNWLYDKGGSSVVWFPKYNVYNTAWRGTRLTKWIGDLSSALPTYFVSSSGAKRNANSIYLEFISSIHARWKTDVLQSSKTDEVGQLLAPLNVKYIAFHDDITEKQYKDGVKSALNALYYQNDLTPVFQDDIIHVFANEAPVAGLFNIPRSTVLTEGGLEILPALNNIDDLDLIDTALIFNELEFSQNKPQNPDIVFVGQDTGLQIQEQPDLLLLEPFKNCIRHDPPKVWSKYNTSEPGGGSWRKYLEDFGVDNWEFDYGKGFVFTWKKSQDNTLEMEFDIKKKGTYNLYIRYLKSTAGGRIGVSVDDQKYTVKSKDGIDRFIWEEIGTIELKKGSRKVTLTNLSGLNAVNLLALVPTKGMAQNSPTYQEAGHIMYIMEAETDFWSENATIKKNYGVEASNGKLLAVKKDGKAGTNLNIVRDGIYSLAVRYERKPFPDTLKVHLDEDNHYDMALEGGEGLSWAFLTDIELTADIHSLTLECTRQTTIDLVILYSSDNGETLSDIFNAEPKAELVNYEKLSATRYKVNVNAIQPFILSFAESYDPLWTARVNSQKIDPLPLYASINGFYIEETGDLELIIEYDPQKWFVWGSYITIIGFCICLALATGEWKKERNVKTNSKQEE